MGMNSKPLSNLHYEIFINHQKEQFSGKVDISFTNDRDILNLNYKDLEITDIKITKKNSQPTKADYELGEDINIKALKGDITLNIEYNANISKSMEGFYGSSYQTA